MRIRFAFRSLALIVAMSAAPLTWAQPPGSSDASGHFLRTIGPFDGAFRTLPDSNPSLGDGYNRFDNLVLHHSAFAKITPEPQNNSSPQHAYIQIHRLKNYAELNELLSLSASAKIHGVIFKGSGGLASLHSTHSTEMTDDVLIRIVVRYPEQTAALAVDPAAQDLMRKNRNEFVNRYGTEYVSGVVRGGELLLVRHYTAKNRTEKRTLEANLEAASSSNLPIGGKVNVSAKTSMDSLDQMESQDLAIDLIGAAPSVSPSDIKTFEGLLTYSGKFLQDIKDSPNKAVVAFNTRSYTREFEGFDEQPLRDTERVMANLADRYVDLVDSERVYNTAVDVPGLFCSSVAGAAKSRRDGVRQAEQEVQDEATAIAMTPFDHHSATAPGGDFLPPPPFRPATGTTLEIRFRGSYLPDVPQGTNTEVARVTPGPAQPWAPNIAGLQWIGIPGGPGSLATINLRFVPPNDALGIEYETGYGAIESGWVAEGQTTRSMAPGITRAAFRLTGPLQDRYDVLCYGYKHAGGRTQLQKNGQEWCGDTTGGTTLSALAVWIVPHDPNEACPPEQ